MNTTWTNIISCPMESKSILLLIEGSLGMTSHSHFPSHVNQSLMPLCLQQLKWWFSWSMLHVFGSTLPHGSSSLPLYPPLQSEGPLSWSLPAAHMYAHLTLFSFQCLIEHQICVTPLAPLTLFTHTMVHLSTFYFLFYHVTHGFSLKIKTNTPEVFTQHW